MKAIVQDGYGSPDALELRDVDKPVVADGDVLSAPTMSSTTPGRTSPSFRFSSTYTGPPPG